jgi:hypothetical protein
VEIQRLHRARSGALPMNQTTAHTRWIKSKHLFVSGDRVERNIEIIQCNAPLARRLLLKSRQRNFNRV